MKKQTENETITISPNRLGVRDAFKGKYITLIQLQPNRALPIIFLFQNKWNGPPGRSRSPGSIFGCVQ